MDNRMMAWGLVAALAAAGCSDDDAEGGGAQAEGAAESSDEGTPESPEDKWKEQVESIKSSLAKEAKARKVRLVETKTAGKGDTTAYAFELTNPTDKEIEWGQAWVYYYDESGECIDRYPHAFGAKMPAGETKKLDLGHKPDRLKDGVAEAEVEITAVRFDDGSEWKNENLVQPSFDREKGGPSTDELKQRQGETVVGEWTGEYGEEGEPVFRLTNIAGKPLELKTVWVYYYGEDGGVLDRKVVNVRGVELEADATIRWEGGAPKDEQKEDVVHIEPSISEVKLDGERWKNANLSDTKRPARALPTT